MPRFTENLPRPEFKLSDETKERLRKVDTARPYVHRAALVGLPSMAAANYMLPQTLKRRGLAIGAIGAAGAGLGLLDRKIESLAEEHEDLRPTLKNYSKVSPAGSTPGIKAASAFDRVRRNREELTTNFPVTMAQKGELQKEALLLDPRTTARMGGHAMQFMRGAKPAMIGAGVGAAGGALADGENRGRGALVGALGGATLGGAATGLTRMYTPELKAGLTQAWRAHKGKASVSAGDYFKDVRQGFQNYKPPAAPAPVAEVGKSASAPMQKRAGMNTMSDAHRAIGGRPPYALLTLSAETSNDAVINQMLRGLFANTDAMRKATEEQVLAAFPLSQPYSYGRHRAIGRTADDIKAEIALAYTPTKR